MRGMRILIVSHCPLERELGAAQIHLNLADALTRLGHTVRVWTPSPLPPDTHWTMSLVRMREKLGAFLAGSDAFDVIDCPPALIRGQFVRGDITWVCRSVQPDLLYLWESLRGRTGASPVAVAKTAWAVAWYAGTASLVYKGWSASHIVMCLGSGERAWIAKRFPWLRAKLHSYDGALSEGDRVDLARVRAGRKPRGETDPIRYLWIGRWSAHKGVDVLLAFLDRRVREGTNEQFTIAGCGSAGELALSHLIGSGRVRVVPTFLRSELPDLLATHDAGLFTSRAEGWGLSLNEMLASGLPVYATRAGGVDDLRSVLGSFVADFPPPSSVRLPPPPARAAQQHYEARFHWMAIAERYIAAITSRPSPAYRLR
jgi:glycosyltransferase involved in cell wall biosynthesis